MLEATAAVPLAVLVVWVVFTVLLLYREMVISRQQREVVETLFKLSLLTHTAHELLTEQGLLCEWENRVETEMEIQGHFGADIDLQTPFDPEEPNDN